jgi:transcriptional regulator with XRE-family HTH domain
MNRIQQYRTRKGMTQRCLADASGVSRSSIANFETGKRTLSLPAFAAVCIALDMSPEEIGRVVQLSHLQRK